MYLPVTLFFISNSSLEWKKNKNPTHRTVFKEHTAHPFSCVDKLQPWSPPELMGQHLCGTISLKCAKCAVDPISWPQDSLVCLSFWFSLVSCLAINFPAACPNFLDATSCHLQMCTSIEVFSASTISYPSELFQKSINGDGRQFFCPEALRKVIDAEHLCLPSVNSSVRLFFGCPRWNPEMLVPSCPWVLVRKYNVPSPVSWAELLELQPIQADLQVLVPSPK